MFPKTNGQMKRIYVQRKDSRTYSGKHIFHSCEYTHEMTCWNGTTVFRLANYIFQPLHRDWGWYICHISRQVARHHLENCLSMGFCSFPQWRTVYFIPGSCFHIGKCKTAGRDWGNILSNNSWLSWHWRFIWVWKKHAYHTLYNTTHCSGKTSYVRTIYTKNTLTVTNVVRRARSYKKNSRIFEKSGIKFLARAILYGRPLVNGIICTNKQMFRIFYSECLYFKEMTLKLSLYSLIPGINLQYVRQPWFF